MGLSGPLIYMKDPHAGWKLTARGRFDSGRKWSPKEWRESMMPRIECAQLSKELEEGLMWSLHQVEAHPIIHEPIMIEDLETGETDPASAPNAMESMPQSYQDAVLQSSKRKKSKGVKRVLSLHYAIQAKNGAGQWIGPEAPMQGITDAQKTWMDDKVARAIAPAPWHK